MILLACEACRRALRVTGDLEEANALVGPNSDQWPDRFICQDCGGRVLGALTAEATEDALRALAVRDVTPQEAFAALQGLGLPEERICCAEVIEPLLGAHGVQAKGRQLTGSTPRYVLDELVLPDGTRICLGASPQGALVYRVVTPHSYAQKELEAADG